MSYKASAPGSLMLLGEYGVLYGKLAIVTAIDKRVTVILTPRNDDKIEIHSTLLGSYSATLSELTIEKPFHFVLGVLKHYQPKLKRGCDIEITSEFSDKVGLGSSSAVTVATLAALVTWLKIRISPIELVRQGRNIIRQIQGVGSGADIAAAVLGGIVAYQAQPISAEKFTDTHLISVLYTGFKTPTVDVIKKVQSNFLNYPNILRHLTNSIGQCAQEGLHALRKEDWGKFGEVMNIQQGMLESLGVSLPLLRNMIEDLKKYDTIKGAKISGSGLGDCVIGLGKLPSDYSFYSPQYTGVQLVPVAMTVQGVSCEKS